MIGRFLAILLASIVILSPTVSPALATPTCVMTCKEQGRACKKATCGALRGKARRDCMETCRGRSGCPAAIRTLAYVVTECRADARGIMARQALRIRRGDCDPVTAMDFLFTEPVPDPLGLCRLYGEIRDGVTSVLAGAFQRLGVSPDGSTTVFEVTTDVAVFPLVSVPPAQQGFYFVRSDGSGLRRLGPASREAPFRVAPAPGSPGGLGFTITSGVAYSPDGRTIAFTDLGPGPAGEDAIQIVTLDLVSGRRTQVTHLPSASPPVPGLPATGFGPRFLNSETIGFFTFANPDGLNPAGDFVAFSVRTDGTGLRAAPSPVVLPGSRVVPMFQVTGGGANRMPLTLFLPGSPVVPNPFLSAIREAFLIDGNNLLQLTNFRRADTAARFLSANGQRVFFTASADPLGANPTANCQLFSVDTLGAHLRQVTHFREGDQSVGGCFSGPPPGCYVGNLLTFQDPTTRTVVFDSSCDPLGTNPYGGQLFAMRPDGSGLRQLTATRGFTTDADGAVTAELPGPFAYSAR